MKTRVQVAAVLLLVTAVAWSTAHAAPKGGSGGKGSDTNIVSEALGWPAGAVMSRAHVISENGLYAAGDAYWNATFEYRNNWYATRWRRESVSSAWVAEDLRPLLPYSNWSWALQVNDAGTVTVRSQDPTTTPSPYQTLVIYDGVAYDLGYNVITTALAEDNRMAGVRYDPSYSVPDEPLYWEGPGSSPEKLPPLAEGYAAAASWFVGAELLGIAEDGTGRWLVKWTGGSGNWTIATVAGLPDGFGVSDMNASGLLAGSRCGTPCRVPGDYRAASWAAPYEGDPHILPTLAGPYSWAVVALDGGAIAGVSEAANGVDMLPVLWPDAGTVQLLPTPCRINSGGASSGAGNRIAGYATTTCKGKTRSEAMVWTLK
jgi:hypothetical protein